MGRAVNLRLSDVVVQRMDTLATEWGITRSAVVSLAVSRLWQEVGAPGSAVAPGAPDDAWGVVAPGGLRDSVIPSHLDQGADQCSLDEAERETQEVQTLLRERAKRERKRKRKR